MVFFFVAKDKRRLRNAFASQNVKEMPFRFCPVELKLLPDKSSKLLILAGGQGTRIRSVSGDLPKCLVPIGGVPFLHYKLCQAIT